MASCLLAASQIPVRPTRQQLPGNDMQKILYEIQDMRKEFREFQESLTFLNGILEKER